MGRSFVDRREAQELFQKLLGEQHEDEHRVINYYGVGGIGKSRLQQELRKRTETLPGGLAVRLDLQAPALRRHEAALMHMRHCLGADYKVQLPLFDIAYSVYWQRTHPNVPMTASELPLIAESEILRDLVQAAGSTPVIGAALALAKGLDKVGRRTQRWRRVRADEDLQKLDQLDIHELLDALTWFFARDLLDFVRDEHRRAVFFIDAHEALWEDVTAKGGRGARDAWIRDVIAQSPGVLWVVCSRDALRWGTEDEHWRAPHLIAYPIGDLSEEDRLAFLASCGITGGPAQSIAAASAGVPFYLNVSVDHWESIQLERLPLSEDFGSTQADLLSRFIGHVPREEEEILKVLSVARSFDRPLLEYLLRTFNIGFPISRWPEFCAYSFNRRTSGGRWVMHDLMRKELQRGLNPELLIDIHRAIFDFERRRYDTHELPISDRAEAFREALLHGVKSSALDSQWFMSSLEFLMNHGRWRVIAPAIEEMEAALEDESGPAARLLDELRNFAEGWILRQEGRLAESKRVYDKLDLKALSPWKIMIGFQVANTIRESGQLASAGAMYEAMWNQSLENEQQAEVQRLCGIQFADYQQLRGCFRDAVAVLTEVLAGLDEEHNAKAIAEALRLRGHVERFNEMADRGTASYRRAGELFERCDDVFGQAIIRTNLAESAWPIDPARAVEAGQEAVEMNGALGSRLEVGKAHVATAYALLLLGDVLGAEGHAREAIEIQTEVGYPGGLAHARLCHAWTSRARGSSATATEDLRLAFDWFVRLKAYPTLQLVCLRSSEVFGERLTGSLPTVQWLTGGASTEARIRGIVDRLDAAGG
jgi:tetratricopeptide (TPR) repeat protein